MHWAPGVGSGSILVSLTPVFLPRKCRGQRSLEGSSLWSQKQLETAEQLTTHTSIHTGQRKGCLGNAKCSLC